MSATPSNGFSADSPDRSFAPPPASAIPEGDATLTAVQRIEQSRERLRKAMQTSSSQDGGSASISSNTIPANLLDALKSIPGGGILLDAVKTWWTQHPLHTAGLVAAGAAKAMLRPMAQKNPLGLMLAMLVLGAALAWKRPWRWLLTPALFAGLLPQLVSKFVAHMPLETWLTAFEMRNQSQRSSTPSAPDRTQPEEQTS